LVRDPVGRAGAAGGEAQHPNRRRILKTFGDGHISYIGIKGGTLKDSQYCVLNLAA
jgi:hypothetical protein